MSPAAQILIKPGFFTAFLGQILWHLLENIILFLLYGGLKAKMIQHDSSVHFGLKVNLQILFSFLQAIVFLSLNFYFHKYMYIFKKCGDEMFYKKVMFFWGFGD